MENLPTPPPTTTATTSQSRNNVESLQGKPLRATQREAEKSFWSIMTRKAPQVIWQHAFTGILWSSQPYKSYSAEREVVMKHFMPFVWGVGSATILVTTFRVTAKAWFKRFRHIYVFRNLDPPPMKEFEAEEAKQRHFLLDMFFGVMYASWAISLGFKPKEMKVDVREAPLLPGRSRIAETMCSELIRAHQKYPKEAFDLIIDRDNRDLETFDNFAMNCKVRARFEQLARERNHWSDNHPVYVPEPGLFRLAVLYEVTEERK